jgi:TetR/AcrR family transcriptional regulator, regulator of autoinduction and epiphytic fitness
MTDADTDVEVTEDRREAILAAALDVFAQHGFKGATIKTLAAAAGLRSPALLYWYFPNKDELFLAVLWRYLPVVDGAELQAQPPDDPPEVFLAGLMRRVLAHYAEPEAGKAFWLLLREHRLLIEAGISLGNARPGTLVDVVIDYLRTQVERGVLRPHDPEAVARLLVAQLNFALQARVVPLGLLPPPADDEALVAETLDIVLEGLRPQGNQGDQGKQGKQGGR